MNKDSVLGLVRHVLTFAGGFLVTAGSLDPTSLETAVGAIVTLDGIVWSVVAKKKPAEVTE